MKPKAMFPLFLFFIAVAFCACSSKPTVIIPPEWGYAKNAIHLRMKVDSQLNLYQGTPHTLLLCVYQLRDPNAFNQCLEDKDGLSKLLECGRFDPSVTYSKRWIMQPERDMIEILDRFEGTKYVGMVAGYYFLSRENSVRFFNIPVVEEKKGKTIHSKAEKLYVDLFFAPQQIQDMRGR